MLCRWWQPWSVQGGLCGAFQCRVLKDWERRVCSLSICEASELTSILGFEGLGKASPYSISPWSLEIDLYFGFWRAGEGKSLVCLSVKPRNWPHFWVLKSWERQVCNLSFCEASKFTSLLSTHLYTHSFLGAVISGLFFFSVKFLPLSCFPYHKICVLVLLSFYIHSFLFTWIFIATRFVLGLWKATRYFLCFSGKLPTTLRVLMLLSFYIHSYLFTWIFIVTHFVLGSWKATRYFLCFLGKLTTTLGVLVLLSFYRHLFNSLCCRGFSSSLPTLKLS